ncbi:ATP-binding cassette domain-containing protein [Rhodobacterales bacterium HKCCE2091]|nr:ATP-binding cassette domain-containing protein [Rhodobacterales bacterium HKCCE2091]
MALETEDDRVCRVENLSVAIDGEQPVPLVDDISIEIRKGDYFALVGESGSGKSITCHAMMRLLPFRPRIGGKVIIDGKDVWSLNQRELLDFRRRSVGMVFQDPLAALNPVRTIGSQMLETLRLHHPRVHIDDLRNRAVKALMEVHIPEPAARLGVYPHQLSGGLNQRVMIALALLGNPRLLIADEPTTALDMSVQAEVLDLIDELRRKNDLTVLLVTHDLGIVRDRATNIAVLQKGEMVEQGRAAEVVGAPRAAYSRELFEAASVDWPTRAEASRRTAPFCLTFNNVNKTYFASKKDRKSGVGIPAAKDMTFSVRRGEIVALIGESGSGKTTAAKMVMGLETPDFGKITVFRSPGDDRRAARVQMVFQHPRDSLDPLMKVEDQLHEVLSVHGWRDRAQRVAHIRKVIADVGLGEHVLQRRPTYLSGGEAQRVVIARALLLEPDLLIADEPLSAVDVRIQKVILDCLKRLRDQLGISILLITHDLRVVFEIADQVVVLRHGRVVEDIPVHQFTDGQRDAYTQMLIDAVPGKSVAESQAELPREAAAAADNVIEHGSFVGHARI